MNFNPGLVVDVRSRALLKDPLALSVPEWLPLRAGLALTFWALAVCAALTIAIDVPTALYLNRFDQTVLIEAFRTSTHAGHSAIWYGLAVTGFAIAIHYGTRAASGLERWDWRRRARSFLYMVTSMAISGALVNIAKIAFGRYRPRFLFADGTAGFDPFALPLGDAAFPSGHTQSIVAAMMALGFIFPRSRWACWAVALVVGASRFLTTVHFLSDVIAGATVAAVTALVMKGYFERTGIPLAWNASVPPAVKARYS